MSGVLPPGFPACGFLIPGVLPPALLGSVLPVSGFLALRSTENAGQQAEADNKVDEAAAGLAAEKEEADEAAARLAAEREEADGSGRKSR